MLYSNTWLALIVCTAAAIILFAVVFPLARRGRRKRLARLDRFFTQYRAIGNASVLSGNVYYAEVVLKAGGGRLAAQLKAARLAFAEARDFLVGQAERYGKRLWLKPALKNPITFKLVRFWNEGSEWITDQAAQAISRQLASRLKPRAEMEPLGYFYAVFTPVVEQRGKAVVEGSCPLSAAQAEICLLPLDSSAAVIAHEVLHLFGARDLYTKSSPSGVENPAQARPEELKTALSREQLEMSVMYRVDRPLDELAVDPATAYAVGWRDDIGAG